MICKPIPWRNLGYVALEKFLPDFDWIYIFFPGDYREMIGKPIPWRDLGYVNLEEFLDQSPDMCRVSYTPTGKVFCQTFCFA